MDDKWTFEICFRKKRINYRAAFCASTADYALTECFRGLAAHYRGGRNLTHWILDVLFPMGIKSTVKRHLVKHLCMVLVGFFLILLPMLRIGQYVYLQVACQLTLIAKIPTTV